MAARGLRTGIIPCYLALCLVLGGASGAGLWPNLALQLIAIPIIVSALAAPRGAQPGGPSRPLIVLAVLTAAAIALQLVPLPPALWTLLPGRAEIAEGFALLGRDRPWLPLSLAPHETISAARWLLPALAILLGIVRLGGLRVKSIGWTILLAAILSVAVGALQIAGGRDSAWYLYKITDRGAATGLFANASHLTGLLIAAIPFAAALGLSARRREEADGATGRLMLLSGAVAILLLGLALGASLWAFALAAPVGLVSLLMLLGKRRTLPPATGWAVAGLAVAALAASIAFSPEASAIRPISWAAALDYFPIGSGLGTFDDVYPRYEDAAAVTRIFVNHAHNDYLELLLETGVVGMLLLALFLRWWVGRTIALWRSNDSDLFARAATIASAAILAQSATGYPLRTAALSALFAACCALMTEPRDEAAAKRRSRPGSRARHLSAD